MRISPYSTGYQEDGVFLQIKFCTNRTWARNKIWSHRQFRRSWTIFLNSLRVALGLLFCPSILSICSSFHSVFLSNVTNIYIPFSCISSHLITPLYTDGGQFCLVLLTLQPNAVESRRIESDSLRCCKCRSVCFHILQSVCLCSILVSSTHPTWVDWIRSPSWSRCGWSTYLLEFVQELYVVCLCIPSATLTEVFPCFFLSCKANARVKPAKMGHGPHSS
jgi:hypothetical protein